MTPKTKLKVAAEEIKEILKKHDIAGAFALHTPGHGEFVLHLNPSYSCAYQVEDGKVNLYAKIADFKTPEEQQQKVADTSNMLKVLTDLSAINFSNVKMLSDKLDHLTNATHNEGTIEPHKPGNAL